MRNAKANLTPNMGKAKKRTMDVMLVYLKTKDKLGKIHGKFAKIKI